MKKGCPRLNKFEYRPELAPLMLQKRFTVLGESPSSPRSSSGPFPVLLLICISSSRCLPLKRQRRRRSSQFLFQWERGEGKEEALFLLPKKNFCFPLSPFSLLRYSEKVSIGCFATLQQYTRRVFFAPFSVRFFAT